MAAGFDALVAREAVERDVLEVERLGAEVFLAEVVAPLAHRKLHRLRVIRRRDRRDEPTVTEHELLYRAVEALVRELVLHRADNRLAGLRGMARRLHDVRTEGDVQVGERAAQPHTLR